MYFWIPVDTPEQSAVGFAGSIQVNVMIEMSAQGSPGTNASVKRLHRHSCRGIVPGLSCPIEDNEACVSTDVALDLIGLFSDLLVVFTC